MRTLLDTIIAQQGKVVLENKSRLPQDVTIYPIKHTILYGDCPWPPHSKSVKTVIFTNENETLQGTTTQNGVIKITSARTEFGQKNMQVTNTCKPYEIVLDSIFPYDSPRDVDLMWKTREQIRKIQYEIDSIKINFIIQNPKDEYSLYLALRVRECLVKSYLIRMSSYWREGRLADLEKFAPNY